MHADPAELELVQHVDDLVLDHLVRRDRLVELHAHLGVLHRHLERGLARRRRAPPRASRAASSATRRQIAVWSPSGPIGRRGRLVEHEARRLAGRVDRRDELRVRAPRAGTSRCPPVGARRDDHPVGGVAVEHERLLAGEHPVGALAPRPGAHAIDGIAVAELLERDRAADLARRPAASSRSSRAEARGPRASPGPRTRRTGPGTGPGPSPRAPRPCRRGRGPGRRAPRGRAAPVQPSSATCAQTSSVKPAVVVGHRPARTGSGPVALEERADRVTQRVLIGRKREIHGSGRYRRNLTRDVSARVRMDFSFTARGRGVPRRAARLARREPAEVPRRLGRRRRSRRRPSRSPAFDRTQERRKDWQRRLNEGRWAAINWPKDWDGREATPVQNVIYTEEMARVRAPGIYNAERHLADRPDDHQVGHRRAAAALAARASSTPDEHWCQGFSEPEAGSDLANLRTMAIARRRRVRRQRPEDLDLLRAPRRSGACSCCAPTPTAIERGAKHEGITAFIIDMETPGIECRPIRDITGDRCFNEVWFTDAAHPASTAGSATRARAGRSRWARSVTSASAPSGLAITMAADLRSMISAARAVNPDALDDPEIRERIARRLHRHRVHEAPQLPGAHEDHQGPEELARGAAGQAAVELRSRRRWPSSRSTCSAPSGLLAARAVPTPSTAAPGPASTPSSATRRSAPARPRCRRTSSPTAR